MSGDVNQEWEVIVQVDVHVEVVVQVDIHVSSQSTSGGEVHAERNRLNRVRGRKNRSWLRE